MQRALNLVYRNREDYVAVLFYASWCPFSKIFRPNLQVLSSLFPKIRHFAFEESVIRPRCVLKIYSSFDLPHLLACGSLLMTKIYELQHTL